jgi:hypothetical protein
MTWGDRIFSAVTPYEAFHRRLGEREASAAAARGRSAAAGGRTPAAVVPPLGGWSARTSRQWARAALKLEQQRRRGASLSARRAGRSPRRARPQGRGGAVSSSPRGAALAPAPPLRGEGFGGAAAPLAPHPPGGGGGGGTLLSRFTRERVVQRVDPNVQRARSLPFLELRSLRQLSDFESLLEACNQFEAPLCVAEAEEKRMRRHMKYESRTELEIKLMTEATCASTLRARLLELLEPIYRQKVRAQRIRIQKQQHPHIEAATPDVLSDAREQRPSAPVHVGWGSLKLPGVGERRAEAGAARRPHGQAAAAGQVDVHGGAADGARLVPQGKCQT